MLRLLLFLPLLALLVAFALSNPEPVSLGLWPFETVIENISLGIAVLAVAAIFFMLGALIVWIPALSTRARARRAERKLARLEAEAAARDKRALVTAR